MQVKRAKEKKIMKVCIPITEYHGLESAVHGHFGSAPGFVLVDSETMSAEFLGNRDQGHVHGQCSPVQALAGARPDAVVVGGIGRGALFGLRQAGIKVYQAGGRTVAEALALLDKGDLKEMDSEHTCAGHGEGSECHTP
jgi:predicted Fe-Mo cluster-binding NifX family protein